MGNGTELGRVRGLGSAHSGVHGWLIQRITAVANLALLAWLLVSLVFFIDAGTYAEVTAWIARPTVAVPLVLLVISVFVHLRHGLQVMIEDYFHGEATKLAALIALTFFSWGGMIFALFCIAKIALGGAA